MKSTSTLWKYISAAAEPKGLSEEDRFRVLLINQLSIFCGVIVTLIGVILWLSNAPWPTVLIAWAFAGVDFLIPYVTKKSSFNLARYLFLLTWNDAALIVGGLISDETLLFQSIIYLFIFSSISVLLVTGSWNHPRSLIPGLLIIALSLILVQPVDHILQNPNKYSQAQIEFFYFSSFAICFVILSFSLLYFQRSYKRMVDALFQETVDQNGLLNAQQKELQHTIHTLKESEERFQALAQNVPGVIYQFIIRNGTELALQYLSPRVTEIFERDSKDLELDTGLFLASVHRNDLPLLYSSLTEAAKKRSDWRFEGRIFTPSGEMKWVQTAAKIKVLDTGDIQADGVLLDVTEQRFLHERKQHNNVLLVNLSRHESINTGDLDASFKLACKTMSQGLGVERASIWFIDDQAEVLTCYALYKADDENYEMGSVLNSRNFPSYFEALKNNKYIAANNAFDHPATKEFIHTYLLPMGISSMLDVAIWNEGKLMGILCAEHVGDPRRWTQDDIQLANSVSDSVSQAITVSNRIQAQLELQKLNEQLEKLVRARTQALSDSLQIIEEKNRDITDSIAYASRIQQSILPRPESLKSFVSESFILFKPKDIVSGDFFWFYQDNDTLYLAALDCTGHGVPGALMSMIGNTHLHQIIALNRNPDPASILKQLDQKLSSTLNQHEQSGVSDGMDVALCVYQKKQKKLLYAGANRNLLLFREKEVLKLKGDRLPIGSQNQAIQQEKTFHTHELSLLNNDTFYLFTDGYADQFGGPKGKKMMQQRFQEFLASIQHQSLSLQEESLKKHFQDWKGNSEQVDDVLVIGLRVTQ